jgi:integrator complex subunit 9
LATFYFDGLNNSVDRLALPFITEETNFRGLVLATEPTIHFGRIFMEETIEFIERAATSRKAHRSGN